MIDAAKVLSLTNGERGVLAEALDGVADLHPDEVVAEVHHEVGVAEEALRCGDRVGEAGGAILEDVFEAGAERAAVAEGFANFAAGLGGDDDADLGDASVDEVVDHVEEHRPIGDRDELFGARIGERAEPGAGAAGEDQTFHDDTPSLSRR